MKIIRVIMIATFSVLFSADFTRGQDPLEQSAYLAPFPYPNPNARTDEWSFLLEPLQTGTYNVFLNDGNAWGYQLGTPVPAPEMQPWYSVFALWAWRQTDSTGNSFVFEVVNTVWEEKKATVNVTCWWDPVAGEATGNSAGEAPGRIDGWAQGIANHLKGHLQLTELAILDPPDYLCINESLDLSAWVVRPEDFPWDFREAVDVEWEVTPSSSGTFVPPEGHSVTFTPLEAGEVTITATVPGTDGPITESITITIIKVDPITAHSTDSVSYYLEEKNDVDHIGTVKGSGNVVLKATITPDTAETRAVIDWQGAAEDASDPLKATLSRSTSAKMDVSVLVNGTSCRDADVWVVWTDFTAFNNSGPTPSDSSVSPDGTYGIAYGASTGTRNGMLLQSTISPSGLNAVGNVLYDIKRTKERATWSKTGNTWQQDTHVGPGDDDDSGDVDEDLSPSSTDHIYVTDTPGFRFSTSFADEAVYKASFVEFVNIKLGSSSWIKASDDYEWHSITWLEDDGSGQWQRKTTEPNEIETGSTTVGTSSTP